MYSKDLEIFLYDKQPRSKLRGICGIWKKVGDPPQAVGSCTQEPHRGVGQEDTSRRRTADCAQRLASLSGPETGELWPAGHMFRGSDKRPDIGKSIY